jgi:hypothetical protein
MDRIDPVRSTVGEAEHVALGHTLTLGFGSPPKFATA